MFAVFLINFILEVLGLQKNCKDKYREFPNTLHSVSHIINILH